MRATQKCRHIEVVHRGFAADFAYIFLNLMHDVGRLLWRRRRRLGLGNFRLNLPRLGNVRRLLLHLLFVRVFEAGGDDGDLDRVFHLIVLHGAKNNVRVFVRGLLDDRRRFVNFLQREAGTA